MYQPSGVFKARLSPIVSQGSQRVNPIVSRRSPSVAWLIVTADVNSMRVYFRPVARPGETRGALLPSNTEGQAEGQEGYPSYWTSKEAALECLGSLRTLDRNAGGPVLYRLIEPTRRLFRGSIVVSLSRDNCIPKPNMPGSDRNIDWNCWQHEKAARE